MDSFIDGLMLLVYQELGLLVDIVLGVSIVMAIRYFMVGLPLIP
jgi:hypothetical protein